MCMCVCKCVRDCACVVIFLESSSRETFVQVSKQVMVTISMRNKIDSEQCRTKGGCNRALSPGAKFNGATFSGTKMRAFSSFFEIQKYFAKLNKMLNQCFNFSLSIDDLQLSRLGSTCFKFSITFCEIKDNKAQKTLVSTDVHRLVVYL